MKLWKHISAYRTEKPSGETESFSVLYALKSNPVKSNLLKCCILNGSFVFDIIHNTIQYFTIQCYTYTYIILQNCLKLKVLIAKQAYNEKVCVLKAGSNISDFRDIMFIILHSEIIKAFNFTIELIYWQFSKKKNNNPIALISHVTYKSTALCNIPFMAQPISSLHPCTDFTLGYILTPNEWLLFTVIINSQASGLSRGPVHTNGFWRIMICFQI